MVNFDQSFHPRFSTGKSNCNQINVIKSNLVISTNQAQLQMFIMFDKNGFSASLIYITQIFNLSYLKYFNLL